MKIKGSGTYADIAGKDHTILGICELPDDLSLKKLKVTGNLTFEKFSCDRITVSGKCEGNSIDAQDLMVSGSLSFEEISCKEIDISGRCEGDSVRTKNFSGSGKIKLNTLEVEETLKFSGKPQIDSVTADKISIATRDGTLGKVKCRMIKIFDRSEQFDGEFFGKNFVMFSSFDKVSSRVQIKTIDADTVYLENCEVDVIKCREAFIGTNCTVEKLFVAGEYKVAEDSKVGETIHD